MTLNHDRQLQDKEDSNRMKLGELHQRMDDVDCLARDGRRFFQELLDIFYRSEDYGLYQQAVDTDSLQSRKAQRFLEEEEELLQRERLRLSMEREEWEKKGGGKI